MRICLVGATHPCHNPRLVREADTLVEAGHEVRVVAPSVMPALAQKDQRLLARRRWRYEPVDLCGAPPWHTVWYRGRRRAAQALFRWFPTSGLAARGALVAFPELAAAAAREPADWIIAHTQAALPAAAAAADRWRARLGFDCEDLLTEPALDPGGCARHAERAYLARCAYVSVPSSAIAEWVGHRHSRLDAVVLYNVFPQALAEGLRPPLQRPICTTVRVHWFGQTLGPDRGLEEAVTALGRLSAGVELSCLGQPLPGYRDALGTLARRHRVALTILPPVDHDEIIRQMASCDVGLAPERPAHEHYAKTVTNKVFGYLLAGLAVAATDTPGQREALGQIPAAGFLYPAGQPEALAEGLRRWLTDRQSLRAAQEAAWVAARQRFCWDVEQAAFLHLLTGRSA